MNNNWLFLRGLTRGNIHWGKFIELFKEYNPDACIEYLEIPGNGYLNNEKTPIDPFILIQTLRGRCQFIKNNLSFQLCGVSLGGIIALKWSELYPKEVMSITIINSSLRQYSPFYHRLLPINYLSFIKILFFSNTFNREKKILEITSNDPNNLNYYLISFAQFSTEHKVSISNLVRQIMLANKIMILNLEFKKITILSSRNDRLVNSNCSDVMALKFKAKYHIHNLAGHDLPLDDPKWLIDILLQT